MLGFSAQVLSHSSRATSMLHAAVPSPLTDTTLMLVIAAMLYISPLLAAIDHPSRKRGPDPAPVLAEPPDTGARIQLRNLSTARQGYATSSAMREAIHTLSTPYTREHSIYHTQKGVHNIVRLSKNKGPQSSRGT